MFGVFPGLVCLRVVWIGRSLVGAVQRRVKVGLVAQRITRLTTDQKIAGSNPAEIEKLFFFPDVDSSRKEEKRER